MASCRDVPTTTTTTAKTIHVIASEMVHECDHELQLACTRELVYYTFAPDVSVKSIHPWQFHEKKCTKCGSQALSFDAADYRSLEEGGPTTPVSARNFERHVHCSKGCTDCSRAIRNHGSPFVDFEPIPSCPLIANANGCAPWDD